jgi:hypothetical protein
MVRMKRIVVLSIVVALCLIGAASVARADNYAYCADPSGDFGTLDLDTGVYTSIGTLEINNQPVQLAGLGEVNGTLYGAPITGGPPTTAPLYSINPLNGSLTYIGGGFNDFGGFGSTTSGLYALTGGNTAYLYSVDPATGIATGDWVRACVVESGIRLPESPRSLQIDLRA